MNHPFPYVDTKKSLEASSLPKGFLLDGVHCGIYPKKKDLSFFYSLKPSTAVGVFTQNQIKAAPVVYCQKKLKESSSTRLILINSGCANACTGRRGEEDVQWTLAQGSALFRVPASQILLASTGSIGHYLPRRPLERGLKMLGVSQKEKSVNPRSAALAMLTTDTRSKAAHVRFTWQGKTYTLWGCAKGSGMIHPHMATMLSVLLTDIQIPSSEMKASLKWCVDRTFNRISVDEDTSTNDSVFLMANGAVKKFSKVSPALKKVFRSALHQVCLSLSSQIVSDGEGATRTAWVFVQGAKTEQEATQVAETVATSPLVKTALHGADPNWGRILAAAGRAGVSFNPQKVTIAVGGIVLYQNGEMVDYSKKELHQAFQKDSVTILIDLYQGKKWSYYLTCDYSKNYIEINSEYTT